MGVERGVTLSVTVQHQLAEIDLTSNIFIRDILEIDLIPIEMIESMVPVEMIPVDHDPREETTRSTAEDDPIRHQDLGAVVAEDQPHAVDLKIMESLND